jgi:hypothetical protein
MPYKDLAKRRAADKAYYEKNKEKKAQQYKVWYEKNKEKEAERNKAYGEKNKEKIAERKKVWCQTEKGRKIHRIADWKRAGVICENFDNLYDYYINCKNCEQCNVELTVDKRTTSTTRCLDHCHKTGEFRNVLCNSCNVKRK